MCILPIVVLYNVDFHETNVYHTLLSHMAGERILIYENSPEPQNKCYESEQIIYYHDSHNGGVSAAYNYGATVARRLEDVNAVLLLDEATSALDAQTEYGVVKDSLPGQSTYKPVCTTGALC